MNSIFLMVKIYIEQHCHIVTFAVTRIPNRAIPSFTSRCQNCHFLFSSYFQIREIISDDNFSNMPKTCSCVGYTIYKLTSKISFIYILPKKRIWLDYLVCICIDKYEKVSEYQHPGGPGWHARTTRPADQTNFLI